jgi:hypothetical protein
MTGNHQRESFDIKFRLRIVGVRVKRGDEDDETINRNSHVGPNSNTSCYFARHIEG